MGPGSQRGGSSLSPPLVVAELAGSAEYGGGERYLELLIARLDRCRFQPLLICPEPGPFIEIMRKRGVPTHLVHLAPLVNPVALLRLAQMLRRERVTILQTHGARSSVYGEVAGRLAGVPIIISTVHNSLLDYDVGPLRRWVYLEIRRFTSHLADRIICVSEALRRYMIEHAGATSERTVTVYNGIDLSHFDSSRSGSTSLTTIRTLFKLGPGPLLAVIGRLTTQKGQRYLLEALPSLIGEWPDLRCLIVGEGELRPSLMALARELDVADHCVFAGIWEDIREILAATDVVVIPSVSEGFPFVLLEALAMGKPVVASNVHAIYELIEDRKTGRLVPRKDPAALATAIREVLRNPAWAAEMGREGMRVVRERFTVERMVAETVAVFEDALRERGYGLSEPVSCPCGSSLPAGEAFRTATRRYLRCPSCRLVFRSPRPSGAAIKAFYREAYDRSYGMAESGPDRVPVFQSVLRHLSRYKAPPGCLLDIGCGDGAFLSLCRAKGWTCFGVELSREAAERSARRGITMLPPDWLDSPTTDEAAAAEKDCYDVIALVNVLETVLDPAAVLRRLREALTPEGVVVIRVGNGGFHLFMRRPVGWVGARYQQAFHLFVYSPKALTRLLQTVGLEAISVRNSAPSLAPISGSHQIIARLAWKLGGTALWLVAQAAFWLSKGKAVWAPSFEVVGRRAKGTT